MITLLLSRNVHCYISKDSLGHNGHVQTDHRDDNGQAGQRGSRGCAAADPADTSDGSLEQTRHTILRC